METQNNRFNVVIRIKPYLENDPSELINDEEGRFICVEKIVNFYIKKSLKMKLN